MIEFENPDIIMYNEKLVNGQNINNGNIIQKKIIYVRIQKNFKVSISTIKN